MDLAGHAEVIGSVLKQQLSSLQMLRCTTGNLKYLDNHNNFTSSTSFNTHYNSVNRNPRSVQTMAQLNSLYLVTSGVPDRLTKLQNLVGMCVRFLYTNNNL